MLNITFNRPTSLATHPRPLTSHYKYFSPVVSLEFLSQNFFQKNWGGWNKVGSRAELGGTLVVYMCIIFVSMLIDQNRPLNRHRYGHLPFIMIKQINWNFVNKSKPIYLGPLETKAYTTNGERTIYIYLYERSTCRYVRLNALNVLHGPCFNAPWLFPRTSW